MNAEIICVGTELLLGHTINTDAADVARALSEIGINLLFSCTVGDNPERLRDAVHTALHRSDLVITTGGLGPTGDDLTKETVAACAGKALILHEESLLRLSEYLTARGIEVSESQKKQAMLPEGCTVLRNDSGTAPGCAFETEAGKLVIMLPGPPSELIPMLHHYALPFLTQREHAVIHSVNIHVFGMGEGAVADRIDDLMQGANPTAATYAKDGEMFVRVTSKAQTLEEAASLCDPLVRQISERIGDFVYSCESDTLEELMVGELKKRNLHLACAESCTGGLFAKRLTDIPGASSVFELGEITYSGRIKTQELSVSPDLLSEKGAVCEETALAMAEGVRQKAGAQIGIGITGVAGPESSEGKAVGLVYIALCADDARLVRILPGGVKRKNRAWVRNYAASSAFDLIRRYLSGKTLSEDKRKI